MGPWQAQEVSCAGFNLDQRDQLQGGHSRPISASGKPRASAGRAASSAAQGKVPAAVRAAVPLRAPLCACLRQGQRRPWRGRPLTEGTEGTRDGVGEEASPAFSQVELPLPALPGTPRPALHVQLHAGHWLGLGCWHGVGHPGSRSTVRGDSVQPALPEGGLTVQRLC